MTNKLLTGKGHIHASGGNSSPSWTPSTDSGMTAWYRSDHLDVSGGNVYKFLDKTSNGYDAIATSATITSVNSTGINGHPGVVVDQSSTANRYEANVVFNSAAFTIGGVFLPNVSGTRSVVTYPRAFSFLANGDSFDYNGSHSTSLDVDRPASPAGFFWNGGFITTTGETEYNFTDGSPLTIMLVGDGTSVKAYYNGSLQYTFTQNGNLGASGGFEVRIAGDAADNGLSGTYGELFLTTTQVSISDFNTYVSGYWGL